MINNLKEQYEPESLDFMLRGELIFGDLVVDNSISSIRFQSVISS